MPQSTDKRPAAKPKARSSECPRCLNRRFVVLPPDERSPYSRIAKCPRCRSGDAG